MSAERVLLVDDHRAFRESAVSLLEAQGLDMVGSAASGEAGLEEVLRLVPDVVLVDLHLPGIDGVDVADAIAASASPPHVIIISSHDDAVDDPRVAAAPVRGFLAKRDLTCDAIRSLLP